MFNFIKGFIVGSIVASVALVWMAYTRHVVRTADGLSIVPKTESTFREIYVDTTSWGTLDYLRHRDVTEAMAKNGLAQAQEKANQAYKDAQEALEKGVGDAKKKLDDLIKGR